MSMTNPIQIEANKLAALTAAERAVAAARSKYLEGAAPYEAIGEAERKVNIARQEHAEANQAAAKERARLHEEQRARNEEAEKRRREALVAVERRRLDELKPIEVITEEDEREMCEAASAFVRVAARIAERAPRASDVQNERAQLQERISATMQRRDEGRLDKVYGHQLVTQAIRDAGAVFSAALEELGAALPDLKHAMPERTCQAQPGVRDAVHAKVRRILGIERP